MVTPKKSTGKELVVVEKKHNLPANPVRKPTKAAWRNNPAVKQAAIKANVNPGLESTEQVEAFNEYLALGEVRSVPKVAEKLGKPLSTIRKWSQKYGWIQKVLEHEAENAESLLIEPHAVQQEKRKFGLAMIDKILRNTVTLNEDGTIATCTVKAASPSDIRTLLILRDELLNPEKGSKTFGKGSQINAENAVFIIKK